MTADEHIQLNTWLARFGSGDRTLAKPIFDVLWPILRRFCNRLLLDGPESEDCAQRAIVRVFAQASAFDSTRSGVAWALEIAAWECRTVRHQLRRTSVALDDSMQASDPGPAEALLATELQEALNAAIVELSPTDRVELENILTEQPAGNVAARKRRQRAIVRLKTIWQRLTNEHTPASQDTAP